MLKHFAYLINEDLFRNSGKLRYGSGVCIALLPNLDGVVAGHPHLVGVKVNYPRVHVVNLSYFD